MRVLIEIERDEHVHRVELESDQSVSVEVLMTTATRAVRDMLDPHTAEEALRIERTAINDLAEKIRKVEEAG